MKKLVSKQDLIHDLYTLPISLQDAEMVEEWINNYEPIKSKLISEEDRENCELNDIEWLEEEIYKLDDIIYGFKDSEEKLWEDLMGEDL